MLAVTTRNWSNVGLKKKTGVPFASFSVLNPFATIQSTGKKNRNPSK